MFSLLAWKYTLDLEYWQLFSKTLFETSQSALFIWLVVLDLFFFYCQTDHRLWQWWQVWLDAVWQVTYSTPVLWKSGLWWQQAFLHFCCDRGKQHALVKSPGLSVFHLHIWDTLVWSTYVLCSFDFGLLFRWINKFPRGCWKAFWGT